MIKTSAAALLLTTALMTGAIAQTNTTPAPTNASPATNATVGSGSPATAGSTQFLTQQEQGQFRASKFIGLAIYGEDNQRVGDINEILMDPNGNAKAIVIGVGGFLGIGEKNVALPFSAVEWVNERPANTASNASGSAGTNTAANTNPPAGSSASAGMGTAATSGGTMGTGTGTTASTAASRDANVTGSANSGQTRSPAEAAAAQGYPDHGKIRMSKADLQNAPQFKYYADAHSDQNRGSNAAKGTAGTAPRQ